MEKSPLIAIITGLEHAGTTFLSNLMLNHPKINAGFECGILLADSPQHFSKIKPFYDWMQKSIQIGHWGINSDDMNHICSADNWDDMYRRIIQYSPVFEDKSSYLLDKTPQYLPKLDEILAKVTAPCIVIYKDILFQYLSYKKRGVSLNKFASHYISYMEGLSRSLDKFNERIYIVKYEELYENTKKITKIFEFIELEFREDDFHIAPLTKQINSFDKIKNRFKPLQIHFQYDKEIDKVKILTQEERQVLNSLKERIQSNLLTYSVNSTSSV